MSTVACSSTISAISCWNPSLVPRWWRKSVCCPSLGGAGGPPDPWQARILERLGLTIPHRFPRGPTLFRDLIVPRPGFRIQGRFHSRHARFLARGDDGVRDLGDAKLWLSREGVENPGRRSSGEARLQAVLADRGWRIFHPQDAPLGKPTLDAGERRRRGGSRGVGAARRHPSAARASDSGPAPSSTGTSPPSPKPLAFQNSNSTVPSVAPTAATIASTAPRLGRTGWTRWPRRSPDGVTTRRPSPR